MPMNRFIKILAVALFCWSFSSANADLRFADSCYKARAERAKGDKADKKNADAMIAAYKKAMADSSVREPATEGYAKALYFSFRFVHFEKSKRKEKLDFLKQETEKAYTEFPKNKNIASIYASCLSMWGAEKNPLAAVKDGVANKVRDVATAAGNDQILGRAHFVLPYIPLVLPWPDKKEADKYLSRALANDPRDVYNYFFLAELRFDQNRYADALDIIHRGLARGVRTEFFLEDKRGRWHLKELEKKINAKLDKK